MQKIKKEKQQNIVYVLPQSQPASATLQNKFVKALFWC